MSDEIKLPCADGDGPECYGHAAVEDVSQSYNRLNSEQKRRFHELAEEHNLRKDFVVKIDGIEVTAKLATCAGCGS